MQSNLSRVFPGIWLLFILLGLQAQAQQMPQYSQYIFNGLIINPAYAGSKGILNVNAVYRTQWSGLEGAPTTATISADGAAFADRMGWGAYVVQDNIGAQRQTAIYANASVKLKTNETGVLSLGLAAGAGLYGIVPNKVNTRLPNDPAFSQNQENRIKPDLKVGLYYHTQKFYSGLSASNLIRINHNLTIKHRTHLFFTSGYLINVSDYIKFKPSFLVKEDFKAPTNADLNAFFLFNETIWVGASYRRALQLGERNPEDTELEAAAAMAYMLEFYPKDKIRIGYAYDTSKSGLSGFGSHEISLGYYFIKPQATRTLTPRYF